MKLFYAVSAVSFDIIMVLFFCPYFDRTMNTVIIMGIFLETQILL